MNLEAVRVVLWLVAGTLMALGILGVALALRLDRSAAVEERPHAAPAVPRAQDRPAVAPRPVDERVQAARKAAYRLGILVFVGLAVLTALEFWIATAAGGSAVFLFLIALIKAGLIVQYYMHLRTVWEEEVHG
jgi:hypothetical protein